VLFFGTVALISTYVFLPLLCENFVAKSLQNGFGLEEAPEVDLSSGSPRGILAGEFKDGRVTFANPELVGGVPPDGMTVDLDPFDLDVLGSVASGRIRSEEPISGTFQAELSEEKVARIAASSNATAPVRSVELEEGRLVVGSEVEVLGAHIPVGVDGGLSLKNGTLRFEPRLVEAVGTPVPERLTQGLLRGAEFAYPIGELPFGGLSGVEIQRDRLVLTGEVKNLPLG
jgi:hypothetical protein